jgi:SAM-dependent methyltransferase
MTYLFGDNERAARRLGVLARVFAPATCDFLDCWRESLGGLEKDLVAPTVVDLGCGPGHTTRLLASKLEHHVVGLDNSDAFLYEARRLGPTRVSFHLHDVTDPTFPTAAAHLLYARFLLTHVADVAAVLAAWRENLRPGGWILLEEPEWIATDVDAFRTYLDLVAWSLRSRGSELYVGPRLPAHGSGAGLQVLLDRVLELPVADSDAAMMFSLNLPTLRQTEELDDRQPAELDALQRALDELAYLGSRASRIQWGLRQVALRAAFP